MERVLIAFFGLGVLLGAWGMMVSGFGYWAFTSNSMSEVMPTYVEIAEVDERNFSITYGYKVNEFEYRKGVDVSMEFFNNAAIDRDSIRIIFNTNFPSYADVKGLNIEKRKNKVGLTLSTGFIMFLSLLFWFGNRKKWIAIYSGKYREYSNANK
jgi:hypothetical protein